MMPIRKIICAAITLLIGMTLFASGAGAKTGCDNKACMTANMQGKHVPGKAMRMSLKANCCSEHQSTPCEFQRAQVVGLQAFCISNCRTLSYHPAGVMFFSHASTDTGPSTNGFNKNQFITSTARSAPIYLQNLSLIC